MAKTTSINIRMDADLKHEAETLFANLGFNMATAFNIFVRQSIQHGGLPFEVKLKSPNDETIAAIMDVEAKRNLKGPFRNVRDLMTSLLEDD